MFLLKDKQNDPYKLILSEVINQLLFQFTPSDRLKLLKNCEETLEVLEVRAIRGETELTLSLKHLTSLTLDQGIQLATLSKFLWLKVLILIFETELNCHSKSHFINIPSRNTVSHIE